MITVRPVFFSCSPGAPAEEAKIRAYLLDGGLDNPTASRYAKIANKNGWTLDFIKLTARLAHDDSFIVSNSINIKYGCSPNDQGSPIAVNKIGHKLYSLMYFLGTKNDLCNDDAQGVIRHEIRHIKAMEYAESMLANDPAGLVRLILAKGVEMYGNKANDISKKFFNRNILKGLFRSKDEWQAFMGDVMHIIDETTIWANATDKELSARLLQKSLVEPFVNNVKDGYLDKATETRMIIGLAFLKVVFDKHDIHLMDKYLNSYLIKYQNSDIYKNSYDYLGLCFDVSKKYFPK